MLLKILNAVRAFHGPETNGVHPCHSSQMFRAPHLRHVHNRRLQATSECCTAEISRPAKGNKEPREFRLQ